MKICHFKRIVGACFFAKARLLEPKTVTGSLSFSRTGLAKFALRGTVSA